MKDPERLSRGDDLGAQLLVSANADAPSAQTRARVAAAVGVGLASISSGGVASGAAAGAGTSIPATAVKVGGVALWMKVVAGGVITVAVAGGTVAAVNSRSAAPETGASTQRIAEPPRAAAPRPADPAPAATDLPTPVESLATSVTSAAAPVVTVAPAPRGTSAPIESALARELKLVDEARGALARGDANTALDALDRHDRAFPSGALRTEAAIVRAEALLAKGNSAGAKKLAQKLLDEDPFGPHARRLRTIAGLPEK